MLQYNRFSTLMPLVYQHTINSQSRLAIWKIEEPETFFLKTVALQQSIVHPHKRLQHLAGRYVLHHLFPDIPLASIAIATTRKPFVPGDSHHFSISHCGMYAAALVSTQQQNGIDIEIPTPKILRVASKFIRADEAQLKQSSSFRENDIHWCTLIWSAKEALFKWYAKGGIDFKDHLHIEQITGTQTNGTLAARFLKNENYRLHVQYRIFDQLVLCWILE